jgi:hypothetical protein
MRSCIAVRAVRRQACKQKAVQPSKKSTIRPTWLTPNNIQSPAPPPPGSIHEKVQNVGQAMGWWATIDLIAIVLRKLW